MKRRTVHLGFAALSAVLATATGVYLFKYFEARKLESQLGSVESLAVTGSLDEVEPVLVDLIRENESDPVGRHARFLLGNAYLREALRAEVDPRRQRPLAELAKEHYRDRLRATPQHWPTRYNLERALRIAPERVAADVDEDIDKIKSVDVIVPDFESRDLP